MRGYFASTGTVLLLTNNENMGGFQGGLAANGDGITVTQGPIDGGMAMRLICVFVASINYWHIICEEIIDQTGCFRPKCIDLASMEKR